MTEPDPIYTAYALLANLIRAEGIHCDVGKPNENISAPYCFVWGKLPIGESLTVAETDAVIDTPLHVQVVDQSQANVLKLAATVIAIIDRAILPVSGWRTFPLRVIDSTDLSNDLRAISTATNIPEGVISLEIQFQATKENCT